MRRYRPLLLLVILMLLSASLCFAAWAPPVNITKLGTGADVGWGVVACDGAGRVHSIFGHGASQDLWSLYVDKDVCSDWVYMGKGVSPDLVGDSLGQMHAVWSEGWEIRYKRWSGGMWDSSVATVSNGSGDAVKPSICIDSQNNIHVVWSKGNNVWYNRRSSATGLWDGPQQITFTGDLEGYLSPRVAAVGTAPVVIWGRDTGGENRTVWFSSKESGSWSTIQLPSNGGMPSSCDVDTSPDGSIYCCWDNNYDIYALNRIGGVWGALTLVRGGSASSTGPHVSAASSTKVDLIWRDNSGWGDLFGARWNGTAWSSPASVTGLSSGGCTGHDITHDPAGTEYFVYSNAWELWLVSDNLTDTYAPPAVKDLKAVDGDSRVTLQWTNPNAIDLTSVSVVYRTDRFPTSPTDGAVVLNRAAVAGSDSFVHSGLTNGLTYYYAVFVCDERPNYSPAATVMGHPARPGCALIKKNPDGTVVDLFDKVVTANFSGYIYVQDKNGRDGIRVEGYSSVVVGDVVNVTGTLTTLSYWGVPCERTMSPATITKVGTTSVVKTGGMCNRSIGGSALNAYTPGVYGGVGLNTIGMLVKTSGKVVALAPFGGFWIDDGSGVKGCDGSTGVKVMSLLRPTVGQYVVVTGINEGVVPQNWTAGQRVVHCRTNSDVIPQWGILPDVKASGWKGSTKQAEANSLGCDQGTTQLSP